MRPRKKKHGQERFEAAFAAHISCPNEYKNNWREKLGFSADAPLYLEIGCGKGKFAYNFAARNPDVCFIALEKIQDVLLTALENANTAPLPNLRYVCGDAKDLPEMFAEGEIDRIFINFCDPWHKRKHYKRRLTYRDFLLSFKKLLKPGGEIWFKTDNLPLFLFSLPEFDAAGLEKISESRDLHAENDPDNIVTEYEAAFSAKGFKINRLIAKKGDAS